MVARNHSLLQTAAVAAVALNMLRPHVKEVCNDGNPAAALLEKLTGIESALNGQIKALKDDVKEVQNSRGVLDELASEVKKIQAAIADIREVANSAQPDHKTLVFAALAAGLRGGVAAEATKEVVNAYDVALLNAENMKTLLPDLTLGTDMTKIFHWEPCNGVTGRIGVESSAVLTTGADPTASATGLNAKAVSLFPHHHYKTITKFEARNLSISWATVQAAAFFRRRNLTLKTEFFTGNGTTQMKGISQYSVTLDAAVDRTTKLFGIRTGASDTFTIAQFRAAVFAAKQSIGEDAVPVLMLNAANAALAENDTQDNVHYWTVVNGVPFYCGCQVVVNPAFVAPAGAADTTIACVLAKDHAYAVLYNEALDVGQEALGGNMSTYIGQGFGGDVADMMAICLIQIKHAA